LLWRNDKLVWNRDYDIDLDKDTHDMNYAPGSENIYKAVIWLDGLCLPVTVS